MSEELTVQSDTRLEVLPSGVRIVRLGPGEQGWIAEYERILRIAAQDFLRRSHTAGTVEGVLARLLDAVDDEGRAVWLVLDPAYRLIGFALAELTSPFGGPPIASVPAAYLYPRKHTAGVLLAITERIVGWAHAHGATQCYFETRREARRAWSRIGARPSSLIYEVHLGGGSGDGAEPRVR